MLVMSRHTLLTDAYDADDSNPARTLGKGVARPRRVRPDFAREPGTDLHCQRQAATAAAPTKTAVYTFQGITSPKRKRRVGGVPVDSAPGW